LCYSLGVVQPGGERSAFLCPLPVHSDPFDALPAIATKFSPLLCFHTLTNCPFSIPFVLPARRGGTFMHVMGVHPVPTFQIFKAATFQPLQKLSLFVSHSSELFCAFLHPRKNQPLSFQAIPNSSTKQGGMGGVLPLSVPDQGLAGGGVTAEPEPSLSVLKESMATFAKRSTKPLGQRTSTESTLVALPRPKCTRMSLFET
jgi:hypothetical protein